MYAWPAGDYYHLLKGYVEKIRTNLRTNNGILPSVFNLLIDDINNIIVNEMGFPAITEEEAVLLGEQVGRYIDWEEAIKRAFWEVVMVKRCGEHSGIERKYKHRFQCETCNIEWDLTWYIDAHCVCPDCKKTATLVKSVPVVEE
jgi:hypothetical protein